MSPKLKGRDIAPGTWRRPRHVRRPGNAPGAELVRAELDAVHAPKVARCESCGLRLAAVLVAAGQTHHDGECDPTPPQVDLPRPRRPRRPAGVPKHHQWWTCALRPCPLQGEVQWAPEGGHRAAFLEHTAAHHAVVPTAAPTVDPTADPPSTHDEEISR